MSKISLKPNSAGTANFEIAAPATNTDRTFTLPDEAGTVLTNASDIESQVKTATNATGTAPIYACRAFVNFDGTGTVAIRESGNVSSITDNGTGKYTVNFANAMPDANYSAVGTASVKGSENSFRHNVTLGDPDGTYGPYSTTSIALGCDNAQNYVAVDPLVMSAAVFR